MTDLKPNAELAYQVLDHIDAHPESWDQRHWCGTSQCFAGWVVELSGEHPVKYPDGDVAAYVKVDGYDLHIATRAAQLLGFPNNILMDHLAWEAVGGTEDRWELFSSDNDRAQLGHLVEVLFGPRPTTGGA